MVVLIIVTVVLIIVAVLILIKKPVTWEINFSLSTDVLS